MENLKKYILEIYAKFIATDKKKKAYIIAITFVVMVMAWAFISAGVITGNFNRAQLKNSENEQKVDALGIIITETKEGQKYFEIYGETGHYSNDHSIATLNNVIGNTSEIVSYIKYAKAHDIKIYPPSINESSVLFAPYKDGLIYPLLQIFGIGYVLANSIVEERKNGKYKRWIHVAEK